MSKYIQSGTRRCFAQPAEQQRIKIGKNKKNKKKKKAIQGSRSAFLLQN